MEASMAKVERLITQPDGRLLVVLVDEEEPVATPHQPPRKSEPQAATAKRIPTKVRRGK